MADNSGKDVRTTDDLKLLYQIIKTLEYKPNWIKVAENMGLNKGAAMKRAERLLKRLKEGDTNATEIGDQNKHVGKGSKESKAGGKEDEKTKPKKDETSSKEEHAEGPTLIASSKDQRSSTDKPVSSSATSSACDNPNNKRKRDQPDIAANPSKKPKKSKLATEKTE